MAITLIDKLRLIREGVILEADDKYDLPDEDSTEDPSSNDTDTTDVSSSDTKYDAPEDEEGDDTAETDEEGGENEEGEDTEGENPDGEPSTSDDIDPSETPAEDTGPKPGEIINLDSTSRKILAYKNFRKYRELRDDTAELISDLSETPSLSDLNRGVINLAIERGTKLLEKMNDYIAYRYNQNSYEVNYKNFMDFVIEKRLIQNIVDTLDTKDSK